MKFPKTTFAKESQGLSRDRAVSRESGFVLVTVLWSLSLISLIALAITLNGRTNTQLASNALALAELEAAADAGVHMALLDLITTAGQLSETWRFPHDGRAVACKISDGMRLTISVQDEQGKVDLNTASEPLLRELFARLGMNESEVSRHVDALVDFRDADDLKRLNGAEAAEYQAAGLHWRPNDSAFHSVDELHRVLGFQQPLIKKLIPVVTVYSGRAGIDPVVAPNGLQRILVRSMPAVGSQTAHPFMIVSNRRGFTIHVEATRKNGGSFVRDAAIELRSAAAGGYQLRRWKRGETLPPGQAALSESMALRIC